MALPEIQRTPELAEALAVLERIKLDLFIAGIDHDKIDELIDAVRLVDAETVRARQAYRDEEFYPYFPESYSAEQDGYDAAEELLRGSIPKAEA